MRSTMLAASFAMFAAIVAPACAPDADEGDSLSAVSPLSQCTATMTLHIRADTYFPRPDQYQGDIAFNGCWRFERPRQAKWGMCDTKAPHVKQQPATDAWFYDEIWQPRHGADDLAAIQSCAKSFGLGKGEAYAVWTGSGGYGDKGCAPGNICLPDASGKSIDVSPWIKRVWLEAYNDAAMDYYRSHRAIGRPMIDITSVADPYAAVKQLCESERASGLAIGVYVGPAASGKFTLDGFAMGRVIRAMNECTGPVTGPKPMPAPPEPDPDAPSPAPAPTTTSTPPAPPPPAEGGACTSPGAKTCLDGDRFIECSGGTWSNAYSCSVSFPGTTCRSGYCVGQ